MQLDLTGLDPNGFYTVDIDVTSTGDAPQWHGFVLNPASPEAKLDTSDRSLIVRGDLYADGSMDAKFIDTTANVNATYTLTITVTDGLSVVFTRTDMVDAAIGRVKGEGLF